MYRGMIKNLYSGGGNNRYSKLKRKELECVFKEGTLGKKRNSRKTPEKGARDILRRMDD